MYVSATIALLVIDRTKALAASCLVSIATFETDVYS